MSNEYCVVENNFILFYLQKSYCFYDCAILSVIARNDMFGGHLDLSRSFHLVRNDKNRSLTSSKKNIRQPKRGIRQIVHRTLPENRHLVPFILKNKDYEP